MLPAQCCQLYVLLSLHACPVAAKRRLLLPVKKEQLLKFKAQVTVGCASQAQLLKTQLRSSLRNPRLHDAVNLDALAEDVHSLMRTALDTAFTVLDHMPAGARRGRHVPRQQVKALNGMIQHAQALTRCREDYRDALQRGRDSSTLQWLHAARRNLERQVPPQDWASAHLPPQVSTDVRATLKA